MYILKMIEQSPLKAKVESLDSASYFNRESATPICGNGLPETSLLLFTIHDLHVIACFLKCDGGISLDSSECTRLELAFFRRGFRSKSRFRFLDLHLHVDQEG